MVRGLASKVYPAATLQAMQDASTQDRLLLGQRQWLVKHTLLPEWNGKLIKHVLHAPTSEPSQVWLTMYAAVQRYALPNELKLFRESLPESYCTVAHSNLALLCINSNSLILNLTDDY